MMLSKTNQQKADSPLYSVVEEFSNALDVSRLARGEPLGDLERQAWEAERWMIRHRAALTRGGAALAVAALGFALLFRVSHTARSEDSHAGNIASAA